MSVTIQIQPNEKEEIEVAEAFGFSNELKRCMNGLTLMIGIAVYII